MDVPADNWSSSRHVSRRKILAAGTTLGVTALAGCSASGSSQTPDCTTSAVEHGDGEVLQQASTSRSDGSIILLIALKQPASELPVSRLLVRNSDGDLLHELPTSDSREYNQNLGKPPRHGYLEIIAENQRQEEIDSLTIEYNCSGAE